MTRTTKGSCNCGGVQWEAQGELRGILVCHCGQCRKQTGTFYAATNVADKGNYILDYALGSVTNAKIKSQNSPISFS